MRRIVPVSAALALAASTAPAALAAGASFALRPVKYDPKIPASASYFIFRVAGGEAIQSEVSVVNTGTQAGTAFLYPVDATTGQTSGTVYLARTSKRRDVGRWVKLGLSRVTLGPGESRVVRFVLHVPRGARRGDHVGGIVAENAELQTSGRVASGKRKGGFQIRVRQLTIVGVEVQLPGGKARLKIGAVRAGGQDHHQAVLVRLKNVGGVLLKPTGRLSVRRGGKVVKRVRLSLDSVLAGTRIDYPAYLAGKPLSPGTYRVHIWLAYGRHGRVTADRTLKIGTRDIVQVYGAKADGFQPQRTSKGTLLPWLMAFTALLVATGAVATTIRVSRRHGDPRS
jgi:hypothetical protein